jgi:CheY-like chemotaxis protein
MAKILVVDNEQDILSSMKTILEKENYGVTCVSTGESAIKKVKAGKFDLVLLDVMMADMSGWEVFDQLIKLNPEQKVMFISVLEISPERKKQIEQYDAVEYLLKPFDREVLIKHVRSMLSLENMEHDNEKNAPEEKGIKKTLKDMW